MISIGKKFPAFKLKGVVSNDLNTAFKDFSSEELKGQWKILFFWPKDFTFVCPTEIAAFGKLNGEFADRDAQLFGVSRPTPSSCTSRGAARKRSFATCRSRCSRTSGAS
jgi:lipoyl-dependent peroxiredoxin subunit C